MRLLLRKIAVLLIATGLLLGGVMSHGAGAMASSGATSMHENHQIGNYADLAIEPGDTDCAHIADTGDDAPPVQHDGPCKKCCAACTSLSLMPDVAAPFLILSQPFVIHAPRLVTLVAHPAAVDPGIPKSL